LAPLIPTALGSDGENVPEITASDLERYSRCAFQALGYQRWRVNDTREPEAELWPDVRGNLLHQAVAKILVSRDAEGQFTLTAAQVLDEVWSKRKPKGLLQGRRVESYAKYRLAQVLNVFMEKEREFQTRAMSRTRVLDDALRFRVNFGDFIVKGTPDRIEETDDGLFVMDYKTASGSPSGTDMLELGYRLQLPFYAIAAETELKRPVLGVQFVELNRKGSRSSGIFFAKYNGKEPGKLTKTTSNSKSLLKVQEPEEVWSILRDHILETGRSYIQGKFAAAPKREDKECGTCGLSDLCGFRRKGSPDLPEMGEGSP
jgi:ATP-dependent helicase/DNAse subunit B